MRGWVCMRWSLIHIKGFISAEVLPWSLRVTDSTPGEQKILGGDGPNFWRNI